MRLIIIFALLIFAHVSPVWAGGMEDAEAGVEALKAGENDKAIKLFSAAIRSKEVKGEKLSAIYYNRGRSYLSKKEYDEAVADFTYTLKLKPKFAPAYNMRGITYKAKGNYEKAIADFTKVLKKAPKASKTWNDRGFSYLKIKRYSKAIADFNKALKIWPGFTNAYYNRGLTFEQKGNETMAIRNYQIVIRLLLSERKYLKKNLKKQASSK